jgi:hypothetical protein
MKIFFTYELNMNMNMSKVEVLIFFFFFWNITFKRYFLIEMIISDNECQYVRIDQA